ncbi:hypothetical protein F5Y18DRAFT_82300 [Xylariaceae sp. FL1019]|nr:hypothetical protein F5Y18DRAFT_82300 [Xylariaceae sp. FL1019]
MDFLAECESLASNAMSNLLHIDDSDISPADIKRWQDVFGFTAKEAKNELIKWRSDTDRTALCERTWELVEEKSSQRGMDKEAYEYALASGRLRGVMERRSVSLAAVKPNRNFLLKLDGVLATTADVQTIGSLVQKPAEYRGETEDGEQALFCIVDGAERRMIEKGLEKLESDTRPFFVPLPFAAKELSSASLYPTLGIDSTMPQHRLTDGQRAEPAQDEFPVYYFFYGTLADRELLARLLKRKYVPRYQMIPAFVRRGRLATLGGKYMALTHDYEGEKAEAEAAVQGVMFLVESAEEEMALRHYETDLYSVARCTIEVLTGHYPHSVRGLTFVAANEAD